MTVKSSRGSTYYYYFFSKRLTVGVTDETMVSKKLLPELILPTEVRIRDVRTYLANLKPSLELNVVPISDPFGPAITDETLEV